MGTLTLAFIDDPTTIFSAPPLPLPFCGSASPELYAYCSSCRTGYTSVWWSCPNAFKFSFLISSSTIPSPPEFFLSFFKIVSLCPPAVTSLGTSKLYVFFPISLSLFFDFFIFLGLRMPFFGVVGDNSSTSSASITLPSFIKPDS